MTRPLNPLLTLALTFALGLALPACADPPADSRAPADNAGGAAVAEAGQEVVYVDVRTPEEFAAGHVEGAINIPHTEMRERHGELEAFADQQLVLYCRSGRRSGIAQEILEEEGFTNLVNAGGLADLKARGVPTTDG